VGTARTLLRVNLDRRAINQGPAAHSKLGGARESILLARARTRRATLFADAPVCKEGRSEVVVGALKQETVSLVCSVESHPAALTYQWTFNNSGELVEVPHSRHSHASASGTPSVADSLKEYQQFHGSKLNYTPATEMDYGTVACWASNQVGKQRTPCLFQASASAFPLLQRSACARASADP